MTPMPDWQAIVPQHAPVVWRTLCRLLPPDAAARVFLGTFMASRNEARRDSVADWSIMLQRLATSRAVATFRDLPPAHGIDLPARLQSALHALGDQQAVLYCLRYLSGLNFNEISMELALPLDAIGKAANEACTTLGERLMADSSAAADAEGAEPEHRVADDLLEGATSALRDGAPPDMPPDLQQATIDQLIAAGPIETYEKPPRKSPLIPVIVLCVLAVAATIAISLYIASRPKPPAFTFDAVTAAMAPVNSVSFQIVKTSPSPDGGTRKMIATVVMSDRQHMRQTMDGGNPVIIWDLQQGKTLTLDASTSRATLREVADTFAEYRPADPIEMIRGLTITAAKPSEPTTLMGRPAQGFNIDQGAQRIRLWADTQTRLPLLMEVMTGGQLTLLLSDFDWNPAIEPESFALAAPRGYQLEATTLDVMSVAEQDLIAALRVAVTLNGGRFPDEFSKAGMARLLAEQRKRLPPDTESDEYRKAKAQLDRDVLQLGRGWLYIAENGDDWHYAAAGAYLGADRPAMWYRPSGSRMYHVIDASLTIRPASVDRLPDVPSAQMVAPSTQPRRILP